MVAKTGLVARQLTGESHDRWKFDQPGTQILLYRGYTQYELMRIFLYLPETFYHHQQYQQYTNKQRNACNVIAVFCIKGKFIVGIQRP